MQALSMKAPGFAAAMAAAAAVNESGIVGSAGGAPAGALAATADRQASPAPDSSQQ